ncbi:MAG: glycosyltransferase family 39 protein [Bacteroides sp.]|nr:glycosyltransferase family 39 protein [Bacteroides sp.]
MDNRFKDMVNRYGPFAGIFLLMIPLFLMRDFNPVNELRYLSIADEALELHKFFSFTNQGIPYADKPPLYFWYIMLCKTLLGKHSIFALELLSIFFSLTTIGILNRWVTRERAVPGTVWPAGLMLITSLFYTGTSIMLRMDIVMCMFIVAALYIFYRIYQGNPSKRNLYLFPLLIFMALFTKGPMGILIPLVSTLAFLVVKRNWRLIGVVWGWRTWGVLLALSLLWFGGVFLEGGPEYLHNLLFNQTVSRAIDSYHHKNPFYYYLVRYWYSVAPWSLLYVLVIGTAIRQGKIRTDLEQFFLTIITATLVTLSLISSKIEIYLLPIFPFLAYLTWMLIPPLNNRKAVNAGVGIPAVVFALVLPAGCFILQGSAYELYRTPWTYLALLSLSLFAVLAIFALYKKRQGKSISLLAWGFLLLIFFFSFNIKQLNSFLGYGEITKKALELAAGDKEVDYYYYKVTRAENMDVFLGKDPVPLTLEEITGNNLTSGILFLTTKHVGREEALGAFVEKQEKKYRIGKHWVIDLNR